MQKKISFWLGVYSHAFKKLWHYGGWRPYAVIFMNVATIVIDILVTYVTGLLVGELVKPILFVVVTENDWFGELFQRIGYYGKQSAVVYTLILVGLWLVRRLVTYAMVVTENAFYANRFYIFKLDISKKFETMNLEEMESMGVYKKVSKIENVWYGKFDIFYYLLKSLVGSIVGFITVGIIIWEYNSLWVFLILLSCLPECLINIVLTLHDDVRIEKDSHFRVAREYAYSSITDLRTFGEKKVNSLFKFMLDELRTNGKKVADSWTKFANKSELLYLMSNCLTYLIPSLLRLQTVIYTITSRLPVSQGYNLFNYIATFETHAASVMQQSVDLVMLGTYLKYFYEFENLPTMHELSENRRLVPSKETEMIVENLTFSYPNTGEVVLKNLNFTVKPQQKVLILGTDGSGKSTLVRVLTGLYKVVDGDIRINNVSIKEAKPGEWKRQFSVVFDDFGRYYFSIRDSVIAGNWRSRFNRQRFSVALKVSGLEDWMEEKKIKEDDILGSFYDKSIEVPSGIWQRIAIARSVYRDCPIMIMDDAFAYVDGKGRDDLLKRLSLYWRDRTVLVIDESVDIVKYFDVVYVMDDGILQKVHKKDIISTWHI